MAYDWAGASDLSLTGGYTHGAGGAITNDSNSATTFNGSDALAGSRPRSPGQTSSASRRGSRRPRPAAGSSSASVTAVGPQQQLRPAHLHGQQRPRLVRRLHRGRLHGRHEPALQRRPVAPRGRHDGAAGMALYVDGKRVGRNRGTTGQRYNGYWRVGGDTSGWPPAGACFAGSIDETAVYPAALTIAQVQNHYRESGARSTSRRIRPTPTARPSGPAPGLYWRLGEATGPRPRTPPQRLPGTYGGAVSVRRARCRARRTRPPPSTGRRRRLRQTHGGQPHCRTRWSCGSRPRPREVARSSDSATSQTGASNSYDRHV